MDAAALVAAYAERGWRIATAESCTGGLIAAELTQVPGSSAVFEYGFVTYSNAAKALMLGVDPALIEAEGAVSEAVARAMAKGALVRSGADVAISVTGIAGPGGGSEAKPVGLVHFGLAARNMPIRHRMNRFGALDRETIRAMSVAEGLALLDSALRG